MGAVSIFSTPQRSPHLLNQESSHLFQQSSDQAPTNDPCSEQPRTAAPLLSATPTAPFALNSPKTHAHRQK
ncbi:hypothetical protein A4A49_00586 [Nicotiana attenuata]|uniref:Uncharacterized protein n=1 Tax=Nicotiana attenuata TaxID=49451 RepID=A0A1J6IJV1_NICAT|nr:hypothetical protein A4A49_00586 [Nicotiana attenuata]